jgi:hypothetical protein
MATNIKNIIFFHNLDEFLQQNLEKSKKNWIIQSDCAEKLDHSKRLR